MAVDLLLKEMHMSSVCFFIIKRADATLQVIVSLLVAKA
jgi:hypothetical protein